MRTRQRLLLLAAGAIAIAGASGRADVTRDQAQQTGFTFGMLAVNGASSLVTLDTLPWPDRVTAPDWPDQWVFGSMSGLCDVRKSDGKIMDFILHPDSHPELRTTYPSQAVLPLAQITALANAYVAAAGWTDTYTVYKTTLVFPDELGDARYMLELHAMRGGAMVLDSVDVDLEPTTGFLMRFGIASDPPSTPASVTPAITPDAAMAVVSSYALSAHGISSLLAFEPLVLGIWRPTAWSPNPDCFLTPAEIQMGQSNQGMLVYYGYFGDQASYSADHGISYDRFHVYVDAQTGLLLDMDYTSGFGLGPAATSKPRAHAPLSWDWAPGPTTAFTAKRSAKAPAGDVLSASGPAKAPAGVPFYLRRGRLTLRCRFDSTSDLVWMTQAGKRVYGRPNKELLKAIVRVMPPAKR